MATSPTPASPVAAPAAPKRAEDYDASSIDVLEGIEHVRARPAMYIGDVYERGLHHLVYEVVDNSVDEALAGFSKRIDVTIHSDGSLTVLDDGRGIPVDMHPKVNKPTVEVCLSMIGAGGKFQKGAYQVSGGLHGVGVSCVNALSEWLEAEVYRGGKSYQIRFARGKTTKALEETGATTRRGTKITFKPDAEIFKQTQEFKLQTLAKRLRELAYLNAGLHITLRDERGEGRTEEYLFPNGIVDFVNELSATENTLLAKPIYFVERIESAESGGVVEVEVAIQYNDTYSDTVVTYANNIATIEGGTHLSGFRSALTTTLNGWLKENEKNKKDEERPSGDDYREGLVSVISVKIPQPQFEGQTKTKLGNSDVGGIVQTAVGNYLRAWVDQNPVETKKIIHKAMEARRARLAAKQAKDLARKTKDVLRGGGIAKLKDAESNDPRECELYLVEGDSAGGTASEARDPRTQAILPLRGKILNVWKATHDKMLSHSEIATMIQAIGTGILDEFDMAKLQFHKIVIMCDADVDGSHIRTLILTFFFRQMPDLIREGKVYVAQPPLYKVTYRTRRKGKGADEPAAEGEDEAAGEGEDEAAEGPATVKRAKGGKVEEYITNDAEFERKMLAQGLQGARVELRAPGAPARVLEGEAVGKLVDLLAELDRLAREVETKGVEFGKYLARRRASDGLLPYAKVFFPKTKKAPAVYTDADVDQVVHEARNDGLRVWFATDPLSEREGADVEVTRFHNKDRVEQILRDLEGLGVSLALLARPSRKDDQDGQLSVEDALIVVRRDKEAEPASSLRDVPAAVRTVGQRGIKVQRYKGLGEMDADELWETTMDPSKRTLLKVALDDMTEANRIFNILMGTKVEPRRDYIEAHSGDVSNLDA